MAGKNKDVHTLEQLLKNIEKLTKNKNEISLEAVLDTVGRRSFGPIILMTGLLMAAPGIGDIPGVPTILSVLILLISLQLLFQRSYFWLPAWLLERSVSNITLKTTLKHLYTPAQCMDKFLKPRLQCFINDFSVNIIAVICVLISLGSPFLEIVPFSANFMGMVLIGFGLALISYDGVCALLSLIIFITTSGVILFYIV